MRVFWLAAILVACIGGSTRSESTKAADCASGDQNACYAQARELYKTGKDLQHAADLLRQACQSGVPAACGDMAAHLAKGEGVQKDERKAFLYYSMGAAGGDPLCAANAGLMMMQGQSGAKPDMGEAERLMTKGCDGKLDWACVNLAIAYTKGSFGTPDLTRALAAFEKACSLGNGNACWVASEMSRKGQGTEPDPSRAASLEKKACDLGFKKACG